MIPRVIKIWILLFSIILGGLATSMLIMPEASLEAAMKGMSIWWNVLFPALFPFFVTSELLLGFGIVHFLGTCFDPIMRPCFRVPGIGGFVFAMGFVAGYPVAAKLTTQLREQGLLTREEGERLVAFTSTSDPVFLLGAVCIGFFHNSAIAPILATAHYGSAIILGLFMRFHARKQPSPPKSKPTSFWIKHAFKAMHKARQQDGRPVGILMKDAIQSSIQLVLVVGCLVVFFSVLLELLNRLHIMELLYTAIGYLLSTIGLQPELNKAIAHGLFEVTLGAKSSGAYASSVGLQQSVAIAAFVLSWSGWSVHAQIVSIMSSAQLRYSPFLLARLLHACLATLLVLLIWPWLYPTNADTTTLPVITPSLQGDMVSYSMWTWSFVLLIGICLMLGILAFGVQLLWKLKKQR